MSHYTVIMLRHGASAWNDANLFTGWIDSELSEKGIKQVEEAAKLLKNAGYTFDVAFTSCLRRAQQTLNIILKCLDQKDIPIFNSWKLNERHYGALTGMNRLTMVEQYGIEQVKIWRRSFDVPPPPIEKDHPHYEEIQNNEAFSDLTLKDDFPKAESLKMAFERIIPYWNEYIVPEIKKGKQVLLALHGTTCRAIIKHVCRISDVDIGNVNVPTAIPFRINLNEDMTATSEVKYIGDEETVRKAIKEVEDQIKKKSE